MRKKNLITLILIIELLLLVSINQSLWLDEATTAKVVAQFSYLNIIQKFSPFDFHPPLYYLFMKFWSDFFGYSEVALRFPSALFFMASGLLVYKIVLLIKNKNIALWSMLFFILNPLIIYYSQEARMYGMVTFFLTFSLFQFFRILNNKKINFKSSLLLGIGLSLSFATFYGSIFLIIPLLFYLLYKKRLSELTVVIIVIGATALIHFPLLIDQFRHSRESLLAVANWKSVLGPSSIKNVLMIPLKFAFGRVSFYPKILYYSIAGIWSFIIWFLVIKSGNKNRLLLYLTFAPLIIGFLFSFSSPLLQYFRFIYLVVPMCILLGYGVVTNWQRYLILFGFITLSSIYLFNPQFHREDWKTLSKSLDKNIPVYMIKPSSDPILYYRPDIKVKEIRNSTPYESSIVVIPYTTEIYGVDYKSELRNKGYSLKNDQLFRELTYQIWSK